MFTPYTQRIIIIGFRCKPLFVGDPTDNGVCVPCEEYCNGHTDICVNDTIQDLNFIVEFTREELEKALGEGPTIKAKWVYVV